MKSRTYRKNTRKQLRSKKKQLRSRKKQRGGAAFSRSRGALGSLQRMASSRIPSLEGLGLKQTLKRIIDAIDKKFTEKISLLNEMQEIKIKETLFLYLSPTQVEEVEQIMTKFQPFAKMLKKFEEEVMEALSAAKSDISETLDEAAAGISEETTRFGESVTPDIEQKKEEFLEYITEKRQEVLNKLRTPMTDAELGELMSDFEIDLRSAGIKKRDLRKAGINPKELAKGLKKGNNP